MKAFCYACGLIQFGSRTPPGAIQIASGKESDLRRELNVLARHGKGANEGELLVPGVPEAPVDADDSSAGDALAAWLKWCAERPRRGVKFSAMRD